MPSSLDATAHTEDLPQQEVFVKRADRLQQIEDLVALYYKCFNLQLQDGWRACDCADDLFKLLKQGVAQADSKQRLQKLEPYQLVDVYRQAILQANKLLEARARDCANAICVDADGRSGTSAEAQTTDDTSCLEDALARHPQHVHGNVGADILPEEKCEGFANMPVADMTQQDSEAKARQLRVRLESCLFV